MTDLSVRVSGGFGPIDERYPDMSPSLRARIAQSDAGDAAAAEQAERSHRARWEAQHERAVMLAAQEKAAAEGLPLREALRSVGHEKHEFLALISARQDLEDAQRRARQRQALRHAGIDPDSGEPIDVPQPSELQVKIGAERAVRTAPKGEPFDPQAAARGIRGRWLRKHYTVME